jgi:GT2 family glycosyltransferase
MSNASTRIGIVFPCHNRAQITLQCLRSLARINKDNLDIKIVVVDDGSTDGTGEAIRREFPDVEVINGNGDLWFTEGTNFGVLAALKSDADFVLMINDDAVFDSDFLKFMVETAESHPRSIVGSLLLLWDTPHKLFQVAPVWHTWQGGWHHWYEQTVWTVPDKPWQVDLIVGNCVLVPAAAFKEGGLMDSRRYPNFGDAEFTPRLKRLGWQLIIDPRARVFCQPNTPPARVREMGFKKKFSALIVDLGNHHNLRRRLYEYLAGAPSKIQGLIAFGIFLVKAVIRHSPENLNGPEPPLNKTFASAVLHDRS